MVLVEGWHWQDGSRDVLNYLLQGTSRTITLLAAWATIPTPCTSLYSFPLFLLHLWWSFSPFWLVCLFSVQRGVQLSECRRISCHENRLFRHYMFHRLLSTVFSWGKSWSLIGMCSNQLSNYLWLLYFFSATSVLSHWSPQLRILSDHNCSM